VESARTELRSISRRLSDAFPATNLGWVVNPIPLRETVVGEVRAQLLVLLGAVALVLLIVCADVASLSLVRATARGHEIAVRTALGAGRLRIVRQLLAESAILALGGGVAGVLAAVWGVEMFVAAAPPGLPRLDAVGVDGRVLGFALVLVLGCVLLFGAAPALYAGRGRAAEALRESARSGRGAQGRMLRSGFVVAQIALAIVLLVGAALLVGSLAGLRRVDPGFEPDHLLTARIGGPGDRYDSPEKLLALFERIAGDVAGLPGVRSAAFVNHFPMTGSGVVTPVAIPGRTVDAARDIALFRTADSGYFATAGIRVVRGRGFSAADMSPASTALIVNEALADSYWPESDAIGRSMTVRKQVVGRPDFDAPVSGTIVGIVANTHVASLAEPADPEVFVPMPVNPWRGGYLVVRTSGDPAALAGAVRRAVQAVDPDLTAARIEPAATRIAGSLARQRFGGLLLSAFAAVALLLAALGLYGVMSYAVVQRTREIGVRSALGARPREIARMFVGEGLRLALAGIAIGVTLALGATRVLESMVYDLSVRDPATFLAVSVGLAAVALLASWIPARRAAKVDPVVALREQ
jgi:predicted permease